jgi:hypothetical protein
VSVLVPTSLLLVRKPSSCPAAPSNAYLIDDPVDPASDSADPASDSADPGPDHYFAQQEERQEEIQKFQVETQPFLSIQFTELNQYPQQPFLF